MREDFSSQRRHVVDAAVWLRRVPVKTSTAGSFLRSGDTIDLSNVLDGDVGLPWAQRHTWKCRNAVYIVINFIRLDI